jgi:hypothetical protein
MTQADIEARARETLADAYEKAGYPDEAAAFRAGKWTCHDHPAYLAILAFREEAITTRDETRARVMNRILTDDENAIWDMAQQEAFAEAAERLRRVIAAIAEQGRAG